MKKRLPWIALILCAILLAALVFGVLAVAKFVNRASGNEIAAKSVAEYFEETWEGFTLSSYDSEAQTAVLEKTFDVTYEQAYSFGKECYESLALGHVETMRIMQSGCAAACGTKLSRIEINGVSSDGKVIYTVTNDGDLTACWQN